MSQCKPEDCDGSCKCGEKKYMLAAAMPEDVGRYMVVTSEDTKKEVKLFSNFIKSISSTELHNFNGLMRGKEVEYFLLESNNFNKIDDSYFKNNPGTLITEIENELCMDLNFFQKHRKGSHTSVETSTGTIDNMINRYDGLVKVDPEALIEYKLMNLCAELGKAEGTKDLELIKMKKSILRRFTKNSLFYSNLKLRGPTAVVIDLYYKSLDILLKHYLTDFYTSSWGKLKVKK